MDCPQCKATLIEGAEFCNKCGTAITDVPAENAVASMEAPTSRTCAICGNPLAVDARFCAVCGTLVGEPAGVAQDATMVETPAAARAGGPAPAMPDAPTQVMGGQWSAPPPQSPPPGWTPQPGYYAGPDWFSQTAARLKRVFLLDASLYREVRTDPSATSFSIAAAVLGMFAFALGGFLWTAIEFEGDWEMFWKSALIGTLIGLALWGVGVGVTVVVLMNVFHKTVRFDEALRVAGAATAILAVGFLMLIPGITFGVALFAVALWTANSLFALRAAFDLDDRQAIVASLAGFAVWALVLPLIVSTENPLGPGIFLFDWTKDSVADIYQSLQYIMQ